MEKLQGLIIKAVSGFYYVEAADCVYECKARGIFRKRGISPSVGDRVEITVLSENTAQVEEILPRKNYLVRPPLANLDRLFIVSSASQPSPNTLIIDKICAVAVSKGIEPVVVFTKTDLADCSSLVEIYRSVGIECFSCSIMDEGDKQRIISMLIATAEISKKLGRGRHTTRHSELYPTSGGYVADTPGFSTVDIERYELLRKNEIADCFPEFREYIGKCRFTGCSHMCEKGCAVIEAVSSGDIPASRHESYKQMYNEVKDIPEWKKNP